MGTHSLGKTVISAALAALGLAACGGGTTLEEAFAQRLIGKYERVSPVPAPGGGTAQSGAWMAWIVV